jgi:hypothetical protein
MFKVYYVIFKICTVIVLVSQSVRKLLYINLLKIVQHFPFECTLILQITIVLEA